VNAPSRRITADGKTELVPAATEINATCNLSEYTEELMIPEMLELIEDYEVDGFWVDGENWGSAPCYCHRCLKSFKEKTGISDPPLMEGEQNWDEWLQFQRDNFENHVQRYLDAIKNKAPQVTVCSNWMYTSREPDDMKVPVDYISGDFDFIWSTVRAMNEARLMDGRGVSWDLMAWGFGSSGYPHYWDFKTPEALCAETAVVMSCGGAVSIYDTPNRTGPIVSWHSDDLAEVARFCRARQPYCMETDSIPQIAIMNSPLTMYTGQKPLFVLGDPVNSLDGALHAILDNGWHAGILTENDMVRKSAEYPVCILPEQDYILDSTVTAMMDYVRNGGNLIVSGIEATKKFDEYIGVLDVPPVLDPTGSQPEMHIPYGEIATVVAGPYRTVTIGDSKNTTEILPFLSGRNRGAKEKRSGHPAAAVAKVGKGKIACIYFKAFRAYGMSHYMGTADVIRNVVESLGSTELFRADIPAGVHMTTRKRENSMFVHFVNLRSDNTLSTRDSMPRTTPQTGPVGFRCALEKAPSAVFLAPACTPVRWEYADGMIDVTIPKIGIHDILVIER
jgi:hypothetical protein